MGYLPIFVELGGRPCIVIGGCESAAAKARVLLEAGAIVTILSPDICDGLRLQATKGKVRHVAREYQYGDLRGSSLAYVASANREIVQQAAREARELGIPLNVADDPRSSSFISPASFRRGDLQVAISSSGASPAIARMMRERLEQQIGAEYAVLLEIMRRAREFLQLREPDRTERSRILNALAETLLNSVKKLDHELIEQTLILQVGAGMAELGFDREKLSYGTEQRYAATVTQR
jgi:precorrin-2 dehydrogenase/sirohydrochlorin ferrochelatase